MRLATVVPTGPWGLPALPRCPGLRRRLSQAAFIQGEALIRLPRAGCGQGGMDQIMVDVGHIQDVKTGDEAVLIGHQDDEEITAEEVASEVGTIHYEM